MTSRHGPRLALVLLLACAHRALPAPTPEYLSDHVDELIVVSQQQWGTMGLDTATVPPDGRKPTPLIVGETTYEKGLGHHASGEIVVDLAGEYVRFECEVGCQWQGGGKGSLVFRVLVDGKQTFDSGVMSDSDPVKPVSVPVVGARELKLVAHDAGDGIGCDMANWCNARLIRDPTVPRLGKPEILFCGEPAPAASSPSCGLSLIAAEAGPQLAVVGLTKELVVSLTGDEEVSLATPIRNLDKEFAASVTATLDRGRTAEVILSVEGESCRRVLREGQVELTVAGEGRKGPAMLRLATRATGGDTSVRFGPVTLRRGDKSFEVRMVPRPDRKRPLPPPVLPSLREPIEQMLIEWDWRMQDGIGTERVPSTYLEATARTLRRGDELIRDLQDEGVQLRDEAAQWQALWREWKAAATKPTSRTSSSVALHGRQPTGTATGTSYRTPINPYATEVDGRAEDLWRRVHELRRVIALRNPLADVGPLLFVKQVPGQFSHQLTQYYGRYARPGGGIFVLDRPGQSMQCRPLGERALPEGSYQQPEVSYDGRRLLFSYCEVPSVPEDPRNGGKGRYYHLYEMAAEGSGVRQLTEGGFDDLAPCELPSGQIMFTSSRRGGWHRCGSPGCETYVLTLAEADGSNPRPVSRHETHEWDPSVLADGRVIYTRWDYVDRHAVHYEQLWSAHPDGSAPASFFGNNTFNPVGIWEARQVPGSNKVMATAAAHHAMTAGSIILVDPSRGIDGLQSLTRLTPDALFPESECLVLPHWRSSVPPEPRPTPVEQERWPGHCYRSPYPLSETYFLAAYSFDALIGEPTGNPTNMFGLYLVDRFGNKELLYRDLNIASLWPIPLRARPKPPTMPSLPSTAPPLVAHRQAERTQGSPTGSTQSSKGGLPGASRSPNPTGTLYLQNVYVSDPPIPRGIVKRLRIMQVLPKSTPGANNPRVGIPNASPGRQVLGTVPVEPDGSAYFRAPAETAIAFQALDDKGQAVQTMRSLTYLRAGEHAACVGCHEHRQTAPPPYEIAKAVTRTPSEIEPGPDGSKPLSYPLLVQPVLDKHCVSCHSGPNPKKGVVLTGEPEGHYTKSYNALAPRVPFSAWCGGNFRKANSEPLSHIDYFGARGSPLMKMLLAGHNGVKLSDDDLERLVTWMDANVLFYGTFDPADQARQQRGERIAGAALE